MPSQVNLTAKTAKKINDLELAILKRANDLSVPEARVFYDDLTSAYKEFIEEQNRSFEQLHDNSSDEMVHYSLSTSDLLQNKVLRLETRLVQFLKPNEYNKIKQCDFTINLDSLLQKQKLFVELIESLKPAGDISAAEAETQYNHLNSLYESFILNQTEIATLVKDGYSFDSQAAVWKDVQKKVISFQSTLKKISTPVTTTLLAESENTNEYDSIRRQTDIIVYLNSLIERQNSLIRDIEFMNPSCNECHYRSFSSDPKTCYEHLIRLHEWFISNQLKIQPLVADYDLYKQMRIVEQIRGKVCHFKKGYERMISNQK